MHGLVCFLQLFFPSLRDYRHCGQHHEKNNLRNQHTMSLRLENNTCFTYKKEEMKYYGISTKVIP